MIPKSYLIPKQDSLSVDEVLQNDSQMKATSYLGSTFTKAITLIYSMVCCCLPTVGLLLSAVNMPCTQDLYKVIDKRPQSSLQPS